MEPLAFTGGIWGLKSEPLSLLVGQIYGGLGGAEFTPILSSGESVSDEIGAAFSSAR